MWPGLCVQALPWVRQSQCPEGSWSLFLGQQVSGCCNCGKDQPHWLLSLGPWSGLGSEVHPVWVPSVEPCRIGPQVLACGWQVHVLVPV